VLTSRRGFLLGAAASLSIAGPLHAGQTDSRLVVIILRGAMDGLNTVVPMATPICNWRRR